MLKKFVKATTDGACPRCGSHSFKAKRSRGGMLTLGLLARKTRVECQGCGRRFRR